METDAMKLSVTRFSVSMAPVWDETTAPATRDGWGESATKLSVSLHVKMVLPASHRGTVRAHVGIGDQDVILRSAMYRAVMDSVLMERTVTATMAGVETSVIKPYATRLVKMEEPAYFLVCVSVPLDGKASGVNIAFPLGKIN